VLADNVLGAMAAHVADAEGLAFDIVAADVDPARDAVPPAAAAPDEGRLGLTRARHIGRSNQQPPPSATALRAS
jgi:hypothetical protein